MSVTASRVATRQRLAALATGLPAALLVFMLSLTGPGALLEAKVFDLFTSLSATHVSPRAIVILGIDEPSFQELQLQWPFPRSLHGQLLERLHADGAAAVGFDVVFAEPSQPDEDAEFARAIAASGPVVLAASHEKLDNGNASIWTDVRPIAPLLAAGATAGHIDVRPDDDYVVRGIPGGDTTMAAELARRSGLPVSTPAHPPHLIEYLGARGTVDTRSYYQALVPGLLPPGFFQGRIVLVGRTTRSAAELRNSRTDTFNSPFTFADEGDRLFPGVEIQATLLANRLTGGGLRSVPATWPLALVLVLGSLLALAGSGGHPALAALYTALAAAGVAALSWGLFTLQKLWLPPAFAILALIALSTATGLLGYLVVRRRSAQVRSLFSQYVPGEVVARLVEQPELVRLGGEAREVTLMFTDLANFTTLSERMSAEQTVEVLSEYFNAMTPVIYKHRGTVDKFIGDGIMAFWGAPLPDSAHAEHAVRAAVEMQAAIPALVQGLQARGLPPIAMRIGLHTGRAVIGNVGSANRFSYTAVGDAVNLAARLEGANKAFGTAILLSGSTAAQLPPDLPLRVLDEVMVKGKSEPVRVFTPCDDSALRECSARALAAFAGRRWDESQALLEQVLRLKPRDPAALRLLERLAQARLVPADASWESAMALEKL